jgi:hypothetical protein
MIYIKTLIRQLLLAAALAAAAACRRKTARSRGCPRSI